MESSSQLKADKHFRVYVDCPLAKYSEELVQQVMVQSGFRYMAFSSGPIAATVKAKLAGRDCQADLEQFKLDVLAEVILEDNDLEAQRQLGSKVDESFFTDRECTKAVLDAFKTAGFNVVSINGSYITPYAAAKSVIEILDQLNSLD